jgi:hypothetical protein
VSLTGGIEVDTLDSPLARTARRLETLPGIRIHDVSPIRLGSHSGRRYSFYLNHLLPLGQGINIGPQGHDVILLGVGHRTLVIKKMPTAVVEANADQSRREALATLYATPAEAERVIRSFRFHS